MKYRNTLPFVVAGLGMLLANDLRAQGEVGIIIEGSPDDPAAQDLLDSVRQPTFPNAFKFPADPSWFWGTTATDVTAHLQGDPRTLTWGFVPDGTAISGGAGEPASASGLIAFLDTQFATSGGTAANQDYSGRSWFSMFSTSFNRMAAVSGLTETYTAFDDGVGISGGSLAGVLGTRGDVRIGGHSIDGQPVGGNILAYNYFPANGDMVIDTDNAGFYTPGNGTVFRNTIMHEHGHGVRQAHVEPVNSTKLMEPFVSDAYEGPQIDDILGLHRQYGDVNEKGAGNDTFGTATFLGAATVFGSPVAAPLSVSVGADGAKTPGTVLMTDVNFVSIDGSLDRDFFSFTVSGPTTISLTMDPVGATYLEGPQDGIGGNEVLLNTSALMDLQLDLLDTDGTTSLGMSSSVGLDVTESLSGIGLPGAGTYFARVSPQSGDNVQLYQLTVSGVLIPEPSCALLLVLGCFSIAVRRRR